MKLRYRWQWLWAVTALTWGVVVYLKTDWPSFPQVDVPFDSIGPVLEARAAQTRRVVIDRVSFWLITSAALYVVGHGFAWSRRAASTDITRLK